MAVRTAGKRIHSTPTSRHRHGGQPACESVGLPPMPDFDTVEQHIYGACRRYITQDMLEPIHNLIRDVIDADRASRALHADGRVSAET